MKLSAASRKQRPPYRQALTARSDVASIHYNLGHLAQVREHLAEAVTCYRTTLELDPDHMPAMFNLGNALRSMGKPEEAEAAYRRLLARDPLPDDPEFFKAPSNLGQVLCEQNRYAEAEMAFRQALALKPDSAVDFASLGRVLMHQKNPSAAEEAYRQALNLEPTLLDASTGLAELHRQSSDTKQAAAVYSELLKLVPDEPIAQHMLAALGGDDTPARASDHYVETVFDNFAESFDRVLTRLQYRAPDLLAWAVAETLTPDGQLDVLDAGCGTGLCHSWLRPYARRMVGVDLSAKMLEKARRRGGYDELIKAELTTYLQNCSSSYDLIISADTLVYFGALEAVISGAGNALKPGGLLAFTLERLDAAEHDGDFRLAPHGRYVHSGAYVEKILADVGLQLRSMRTDVLRLEEGQPVPGWLVLAGASSTGNAPS